MTSSSDVQRIWEMLDRISVGVADLQLAVTEIRTGCTSCRETISDLKTTTFGNGHEGIKTRVERLENAQSHSYRWLQTIAIVIAWLITTSIAAYAAWK